MLRPYFIKPRSFRRTHVIFGHLPSPGVPLQPSTSQPWTCATIDPRIPSSPNQGTTMLIASLLLLQAAAAQPAMASKSPVADALRQMEQRYARILVAAAEAMPADKYSYRPTPAQMSFAEVQVHLIKEGNDLLCGKVAGMAPPTRTAIDTTAGKDALVARLKESFDFCTQIGR